MTGASAPRDGVRTSVFAYVTESPDYRAILAVFAGTFFAELTPADVTARLDDAGTAIDEQTVTLRLEQLRAWGNLEVSASVGQVGTVEDYYRRRNRYLITRVGQEVHDVVEGVLAQVDDVRDVSLGRLEQLRAGLETLARLDAATAPPDRLAEAVRGVFDPHVAFSAEITQFFAAINQWQSRFDLDADEFAFFSEVLVGYVGERLETLRRAARPIAALLETVGPRVPTIVDRAADGLAARVAAAGLSAVRVRREPGAAVADWENLASWFVSSPGRPSRVQTLERDAVDAVRTLTQNLTRLSRTGTAGSSRRVDFLRLAMFFGRSDATRAHELAAAAFGLHGARHLGVAGGDDTDPVSSSISWWDAPVAPVPVSLRERGDTTSRGRTSRVADRSQERRHLLARRAEVEKRAAAARAELLEAGAAAFTDRLSEPALRELQRVLTRAVADLGPAAASGSVALDGVRCVVTRTPGETTTVPTHGGSLRLEGLALTVEPT
ncbi:TIGR02677 family protein [Actinomycetospora sp. C-140]